MLREKCNRPMLLIELLLIERQKALLLEVYKCIHKLGLDIDMVCSLKKESL